MKQSRRLFLQTIPTAGMLTINMSNAASDPSAPSHFPKPFAIKPGDKIGLVCPGSLIKPELIANITAYFEKRGYRCKVGESVSKQYLSDLAGTDEERAQDFNSMITDDSIAAVIALQGGYGATRILPLIDYNALAKHPKWIAGNPAITGFHLSIFQHTGLLTLLCPSPVVAFEQNHTRCDSEQTFWDTLEGRMPVRENLFTHYTSWESNVVPETWIAGKAAGVLLGGSLERLASLAGTPYAIPRDKDILLFLEESGEAAYRVDRLLTQLRDSGGFEGVKGILAGRFIPPKDEPNEAPIIRRVLRDQLMRHGVPVLAGVPVGRQSYDLSIAYGAWTEMDAEMHSLHYLESITS